MKLRIANYELRSAATDSVRRSQFAFKIRHSTFARAFTLIELILVLALLVIITSLAAPAMSRFHPRPRAGFRGAAAVRADARRPEPRGFRRHADDAVGGRKSTTPTASQAETTGAERRPEGGRFDGGFDAANRGAERRHWRADDVQQSAGDPIFGGRHGGRKQSADVAIDGYRRVFALADGNEATHGL